MINPWTLPALVHRLATQPELVRARDELRAGHGITVDGAWGSAKSLVIAASLINPDTIDLSQKKPKKQKQSTDAASIEPTAQTTIAPLLVIVPNASQLEDTTEDLRTWLGLAPLVLPQLDSVDRSSNSVESFGKRLRAIRILQGDDPPRAMITTVAALLQTIPNPDAVDRASQLLKRGQTINIEQFLGWLDTQGWERRDAVEIPGEYSLRGGILDLYPPDANDPVRLELFGDEIDSIREFSIESQRSHRTVEHVWITSLKLAQQSTAANTAASSGQLVQTFLDLLPRDTVVSMLELNEIRDEARQYLEREQTSAGLLSFETLWQRLLKFATISVSNLPTHSLDFQVTLRTESVEHFGGELSELGKVFDLTAANDHVLLTCHHQAEIDRLKELFVNTKMQQEGRLHYLIGRLAHGFRWVDAGILTLSDNELFGRTEVRRIKPRKTVAGQAIDSFTDLQPGDYVVHLSHGIGIFRGTKMLEKNDQFEEHLTLEFADSVLMYVPVSKIDLVQKYVGSSAAAPRLAKIGGTSWERKKAQVQKAVEDFAAELIETQAARQTKPGHAFPPDSRWQLEFEASFPFTETRDQLLAMEQVKSDMQSHLPMDRLICGDVGYGKTEVAIRAAFKAADSGKQVAVLVPTTVLAQQHARSFKARMAEFPFRVECLTRFESPKEQRTIIADLGEGKVDVLIGTHRILSADVQFQDLGLVIVDEEQRFGVDHKERLKRMRSTVDVLTLTATPIPRTLHQSLLGIRDISNLETAPVDRMSVETRISRFDATLIRHAIVRELNRTGQIYFVHNRVKDLPALRGKLIDIVPEARVAIIHGQMTEDQVEEGMLAFLERRADILLATTIIESGLDIPNANTIFINEADIYGLADMHQLRGRVGRSNVRAYCYLLVDDRKLINTEAQRRLKAIEEYSNLGAGFKIALRDLEIRGAGNILGTAQSGHIAAIGYELYCHLLENAVRTLKKQPLRAHIEATVELPWEAYFPAEFLPGERFRVDAYRRLSRIRDLDQLEDFRKELEDRFGELPQPALNLIDIFEIRLLAHIWQIDSVRTDEHGWLMLGFRNPKRIRTLADMRSGQITLLDNKSAVIRIKAEFQEADAYARVLKRLLQPT